MPVGWLGLGYVMTRTANTRCYWLSSTFTPYDMDEGLVEGLGYTWATTLPFILNHQLGCESNHFISESMLWVGRIIRHRSCRHHFRICQVCASITRRSSSTPESESVLNNANFDRTSYINTFHSCRTIIQDDVWEALHQKHINEHVTFRHAIYHRLRCGISTSQ